MQLRHELGGEERPHDLADGVGGRDAADAEAVGDLARERALAGAGGAAEQEHQRPVEPQHLVPAVVARDDLRALLLGQHLLDDPVQLLDRDLVLGDARDLALDPQGQLVGPLGLDAREHERLRHPALRERHRRAAASDARLARRHRRRRRLGLAAAEDAAPVRHAPPPPRRPAPRSAASRSRRAVRRPRPVVAEDEPRAARLGRPRRPRRSRRP